MKHAPLLVFSALLAASVTITPGCKPRPKTEPVPEENPVRPDPAPSPPDLIGAAFSSLTGPFTESIRLAMEEEAATHSYELLSVSADSDPNRQRQQVGEFLAKGVKALAIQPCDSTAVGATIRAANVAGVPVFTFQFECREPGAEVVSHIGANEIQGGRLAGKAIIEAVGESGGEIIIINSPPEEASLERVRGFKEVIGRFNASRPAGEARLQIAVELSGKGTRADGFRAVEDTILDHPHLIGIFAASDAAGLGAAAALEEAGKQDQITVVTLGDSPEALNGIREGRIYAAPVLSPETTGRLTIQSIAEYLDGKEVPPRRAVNFKRHQP